MADRCLIENREAAVGVQMSHMRQRWGAAVWRAQTQVLLGGLNRTLNGVSSAGIRGGKRLSRAVQQTPRTAAEASWRSYASWTGSGGGIDGGG
jgi:hypothetical protein